MEETDRLLLTPQLKTRGATTTFAYNNRRLVTGITYGVPAGVAATPNVSYAYDAAGNRISLTDGLGSVSYNYNTLSQMTSRDANFHGRGFLHAQLYVQSVRRAS